mgnify:CR=1 FL=1
MFKRYIEMYTDNFKIRLEDVISNNYSMLVGLVKKSIGADKNLWRSTDAEDIVHNAIANWGEWLLRKDVCEVEYDYEQCSKSLTTTTKNEIRKVIARYNPQGIEEENEIASTQKLALAHSLDFIKRECKKVLSAYQYQALLTYSMGEMPKKKDNRKLHDALFQAKKRIEKNEFLRKRFDI